MLLLKALVLFLLFISLSVQSADILVVNSYHISYPWSAECWNGFKAGINPSHKLSYSELDTKRIPDSEFAAQAERIFQEVEQSKPDLVVTMDDNALKYLGQRVSDLGIPVVFMGINQNPRIYFRDNYIPTNVTGALERPLLKRSVVVISQIVPPKERRFLLLMDDGMTSEAIIETSLSGLSSSILGDFVLDVWLSSSFSDWKRKVKSVSPSDYDVLVLANYAKLTDESGLQVPLDSTTKWTAENSAVPVFGFWNYSVGKGKAIGGLLISGYDQGGSAADLANSILDSGEVPKFTMPREGEYVFSRYELERWQLTLPVDIERSARLVE